MLSAERAQNVPSKTKRGHGRSQSSDNSGLVLTSSIPSMRELCVIQNPQQQILIQSFRKADKVSLLSLSSYAGWFSRIVLTAPDRQDDGGSHDVRMKLQLHVIHRKY